MLSAEQQPSLSLSGEIVACRPAAGARYMAPLSAVEIAKSLGTSWLQELFTFPFPQLQGVTWVYVGVWLVDSPPKGMSPHVPS